MDGTTEAKRANIRTACLKAREFMDFVLAAIGPYDIYPQSVWMGMPLSGKTYSAAVEFRGNLTDFIKLVAEINQRYPTCEWNGLGVRYEVCIKQGHSDSDDDSD